MKGLTQKELGVAVGFPEKTADIRIAQYESGSRTPKVDLVNSLAKELGVSSKALLVPDIDSPEGLMHTLFAIEDLYGITIRDSEDGPCLAFRKGRDVGEIPDMFAEWNKMYGKYRAGEITRDEYDEWRHHL